MSDHMKIDWTVVDLRARIAALEAQLAEKEAENERLRKAVEEMEYSDGDASFWRHIAKQNAEALSRTGAVKVIDPRHFDILVEAMAEVKATSDGLSDQPIADIVQGCIDEIAALEPAEPECATEECSNHATNEFIRGGVGSFYCGDCFVKVIEACETTRPAEQAVTEAMVEAVVKAIRPYTRDTLFLDEHQILVRAALKAAMEAGRHD